MDKPLGYIVKTLSIKSVKNNKSNKNKLYHIKYE